MAFAISVRRVFVAQMFDPAEERTRPYAWLEGFGTLAVWCMLPDKFADEADRDLVERWMGSHFSGNCKQDGNWPVLAEDWKLVRQKEDPRNAFAPPLAIEGRVG